MSKKTKLTKKEITVDEVLIQCSIAMVNTIADAKREGATVRFETEVNGKSYDVDVIIKQTKKPFMKKA